MAQEALLEAVSGLPPRSRISGTLAVDAGLSDFTVRHLGPVVFGNEAIKLRDHQAKSARDGPQGKRPMVHRKRHRDLGHGFGQKPRAFCSRLLAGLLEERRLGVGKRLGCTGGGKRLLEGNQPTWVFDAGQHSRRADRRCPCPRALSD